jgi:hypothetical protein
MVPLLLQCLTLAGTEPLMHARVHPCEGVRHMTQLTGCLSGILVKVEDQARWKNLELTMCIVVGGPTARFRQFEDISFLNCVFLYDGMEVEGREWLELMSYEPLIGRARASRGGNRR